MTLPGLRPGNSRRTLLKLTSLPLTGLEVLNIQDNASTHTGALTAYSKAEFLNKTWFLFLVGANKKSEVWLRGYNERPHSSIGHQTPVELIIILRLGSLA